jgi:hypothetical protein
MNLLNSAKYTLILTAILAAFFLYIQLAEYNFDHTRFIMAGDFFVDASKVPAKIKIMPNSVGYDGQFFYRLALNPFTNKKWDYGIELDDPPWRQRRFLYPLLAWMLSFGKPKLISWMLIIVNFIAICFIGFVGGMYAKSAGLNALWGMSFPLYAGFVMTITRDLSEIVEISLIIATFYFLKKKHQICAAVALTLAVFTKEPSLLIAWSGFLVFLYGIIKKKSEIKWYLPIIPGLAHVIWHFGLYFYWGISLKSDFIDKIGIPFAGFIRLFNKNAPYAVKPNNICFYELIIILIFMICVTLSLHKSKSSLIEKISWLHYFVLTVMLTDTHYWITDGEFLRALTEFFMTGTIVLMNSRFILRKPIFLMNICFCLYMAVMIVYYPIIPRFSIEERQITETKPVVLTDFNPVHFNLEIKPHKLRYRAGERLIFSVDLKTLQAINVDFYLVIHGEDKKLHFAPSWGIKPEALLKGIRFPANLDVQDKTIFEFIIPKNLTSGTSMSTYTFAIGAMKAGTSVFVSNISVIPMIVAP